VNITGDGMCSGSSLFGVFRDPPNMECMVKNLLYIYKILLLFELTFFYVQCLHKRSPAASEFPAAQCPSKGRVPSGDRVIPADCHPNILLFLSFVHELSPTQKHIQVCHLKISFLTSVVKRFLVQEILMCEETDPAQTF
jgi:hypothetical protein